MVTGLGDMGFPNFGVSDTNAKASQLGTFSVFSGGSEIGWMGRILKDSDGNLSAQVLYMYADRPVRVTSSGPWDQPGAEDGLVLLDMDLDFAPWWNRLVWAMAPPTNLGHEGNLTLRFGEEPAGLRWVYQSSAAE